MSKKLVLVSQDIPENRLGFPYRNRVVTVEPFSTSFYDESAGYVKVVGEDPRVVLHKDHYTYLGPAEPSLGLATTAELLDELKARAELGGYADYRTVDEII